MMKKLTPKQQVFVAEYLVDLNATQAAIRAGYSVRTADRIGPELLGKTWVAKAVAEGQEKRAVRTGITQDKVLEQYARLAFFDIRKLYNSDGTLKPVHEWDDESAAAVNGIEAVELGTDLPGVVRKVKLADRRAALADIGKHLGMFLDRVEHSGSIDLAGAIEEARKRAAGTA